MLTITLLGTAATMPLPDRALTTAVAECVGHSLLFDCGEGTQAAARRAVLVLESAHPSPLSAYRGFFGSAPFGRINAFLQAHGEAGIDWLA